MSQRLTLGNGTELLKEGSTGLMVKQLQERLAGGGFDPGAIDGIFGPKTREAVVSFQHSKGLAPDGIVGTQTWGALFPTPLPPPLPRGPAHPVYSTSNWMQYWPYAVGGVIVFMLIGRSR